MELYKLRYNLYNYFFQDTIDYNFSNSYLILWEYSLYALYAIFLLIILFNFSKINKFTLFFLIIFSILIYMFTIIDIKIKTIIDNKDLSNYILHFKLFNTIFIDSYNTNKIPLAFSTTFTSEDDITLQQIKNYITSISSLNIPLTPIIIDDNYKYISFTSTATLTIKNSSIICDILVIGGGGAGGKIMGGGGGAGGVVYQQSVSLPIGSYGIIIGTGGIGTIETDTLTGLAGEDGSDSFIQSGGSDLIISSITYRGKGGGGGGSKLISVQNGRIGGSGGGGSPSIVGGIANQPNTFYNGSTNVAGGYSGGTGSHTSSSSGNPGKEGVSQKYTERSGGGGGAGSVGGGAGTDDIVMNGGNGVEINITGTSVWYAGGGGGAKSYEPDIRNDGIGGLGGSGVGGNGNASEHNNGDYTYIAPRHNGKDGTGSGGGGGAYRTSIGGGRGGSGIVIIKFSSSDESKIIATYTTPSIISSQSINSKLNISFLSEQLNYYLIIKELSQQTDNNNLNEINELIKYNYNTLKNKEIISIETISSTNYYKINIKKFDENKRTSKIIQVLTKKIQKYFYDTYNTIPKTTDDSQQEFNYLQTLIQTDTKNYLYNFYNTLKTINNEIRYIDNIEENKIYANNDEYIKNNNILKFIDIYDHKYLILKKYIFIKIDETNELHKYIKDNYDIYKDKYITNLLNINTNTDQLIKIQVVIIDISTSYSTDSKTYFLIDIETINKYFNKNKDENNDNINDYIIYIYDNLKLYYSNKIGIKIENFDSLYENNNKILLKNLNKPIDDFKLNYNINLIVVIILLTIILHIFYIEYYYKLR